MLIPSPYANFLQIPDTFVEYLIHQNLTRNEMVVCLHLARGTFAIERCEPLASIEQIALAIGLDQEAVRGAISRAVDRGIVLKFDVVGSNDVDALYGLATEENRVLAGFEADNPTTAPIAVPADSSSTVPRPAIAAHPEAARPVTAPITLPILGRIAVLLGRDVTKDEKSKLEALEAPDDDLLAAILSLESKRAKMYAADQIIYEYESLTASRKRHADQAGQSGSRQRRKSCNLCGGSGYVMVGKKSLRNCDCRK